MDVQKILGIVIMLMAAPIMLGIGAVVVFETTGSIDVDDARVDATDQLLNTTFSTIYAATGSWDNATSGDNVTAYWDNWDAQGASNYDDNAVWDNKGAQPLVGARTASWTRWYQEVVVGAYDGVTSATISGEYHLGDNSLLENLSIYVILERPAGDNVIILSRENIAADFICDNATWTSVDNTVTAYITAGGVGTYILYLQDNLDRVDLAAGVGDNYRSVVWDNCNLSITTHTYGYLENAMADVEQQTGTGFRLGSLLPLIIAAIALISIIVAGFVGMKYRGR